MNQSSGKGYLRIWTTTAGNALPVPGIAVRIEDENGTVLHVLRTGESGLTPVVTLAAPPAAESLKPDTAGKPYASYYLTIETPGYQPVRSLAVPIFDGITSLQPVTLLPASAAGEASDDSPYLLYPRIPYEGPDGEEDSRTEENGEEYQDDNDLPGYGGQSAVERGRK